MHYLYKRSQSRLCVHFTVSCSDHFTANFEIHNSFKNSTTNYTLYPWLAGIGKECARRAQVDTRSPQQRHTCGSTLLLLSTLPATGLRPTPAEYQQKLCGLPMPVRFILWNVCYYWSDYVVLIYTKTVTNN